MNPIFKRVLWWLEFVVPIIVAFPFLFSFITLTEGTTASQCLGVVIITAAWWIFEPIPIVVTAFVPVFLLPMFGVSSAKNVASSMFSDTSLVFLGGFLFSIAMVRWNLHSRIALKTVLIFGLRPKLLLLGIMIVTAFLSMWISNTATALTMVPNALAIITKIEELTGDTDAVAPFSKSLFLGIAYAASVGGMATLIGTPPNLIFAQVSADTFPGAPSISFANFMGVALPTTVLIIAVLYLFFIFVYLRKLNLPPNMDESTFRENYEKLGKMSPAEIIVGLDFILLALMWLFRGDLGGMKGWANLLLPNSKGSDMIQDGTIALCLGIILFIIHVPQPTEKEERKLQKAEVDLELRHRNNHNRTHFRSPLELPSSSDDGSEEEDFITERKDDEEEAEYKWVPIIDWEYVQSKIPWTILFLFAGGFALNQGFKDSTLDSWVGSKLASLTNMPLFALLLCIVLITSILSNIASNTACANILIPIVANLARESGKYHPWMLMIATAFATSCCFIMPVATPPNLICFGSGRLETKDFMIAGSFINIVSLFIICGMCIALIPPVLDAHDFPAWANTTVVE